LSQSLVVTRQSTALIIDFYDSGITQEDRDAFNEIYERKLRTSGHHDETLGG
jgi:hypothetical protein